MRLRSAAFSIVLLTALFGAPGCYWDLGTWDSSTDVAIGWAGPASNMDVDDAYLEGQIGRVQNVDGLLEVHGYGDEWAASVETHAQGRNGVAMTNLYVEGGFDAETFHPGASLVIDHSDPFDGSEISRFSMVGCSGEQQYEWEYDSSAERIEIDVYEGLEPGSVRIEYQATFQNYSGGDDFVATGGFEVAVR